MTRKTTKERRVLLQGKVLTGVRLCREDVLALFDDLDEADRELASNVEELKHWAAIQKENHELRTKLAEVAEVFKPYSVLWQTKKEYELAVERTLLQDKLAAAERELRAQQLDARLSLDTRIAVDNERTINQQVQIDELRTKLAEAQSTIADCDFKSAAWQAKLAETEAEYVRGADAFADELLALREVAKAARDEHAPGHDFGCSVCDALAAHDALRREP